MKRFVLFVIFLLLVPFSCAYAQEEETVEIHGDLIESDFVLPLSQSELLEFVGNIPIVAERFLEIASELYPHPLGSLDYQNADFDNDSTWLLERTFSPLTPHVLQEDVEHNENSGETSGTSVLCLYVNGELVEEVISKELFFSDEIDYVKRLTEAGERTTMYFIRNIDDGKDFTVPEEEIRLDSAKGFCDAHMAVDELESQETQEPEGKNKYTEGGGVWRWAFNAMDYLTGTIQEIREGIFGGRYSIDAKAIIKVRRRNQYHDDILGRVAGAEMEDLTMSPRTEDEKEELVKGGFVDYARPAMLYHDGTTDADMPNTYSTNTGDQQELRSRVFGAGKTAKMLDFLKCNTLPMTVSEKLDIECSDFAFEKM